MRLSRLFQSLIGILSRGFVGGVLAFSGFVKAVDPLGTAYKMQDYFAVANLEALYPLSLPLAILLNTIEFVVGCAILAGWARRLSSMLALGMMLFFTPLTLFIAITNPVPHCGCFGDAWIITNWQTFFKNAGLLIAACVIFWQAQVNPQTPSALGSRIGLGVATAAILGLSIHALLYLPVIDFRPWKVGNHIPSLLQEEAPPVIQHTFIYEHVESGDIRRIAEQDLMDEGVPDPAEWRFAERRQIVMDPGVPAAIENFSIHDEWGDDYTDFYIRDNESLLIVVVDDIRATRPAVIVHRVEVLAESAAEQGIPLIALTSSPFVEIHEFASTHALTFPFYQTDERTLKTMIRSNPGLILLKDGTVAGKWPHRRMPSTWDEIESPRPNGRGYN